MVTVFKDQGISAAPRDAIKRPGLDKLLQAVARKEFDMVAAWSVDRLGRSLIDLVGILQEFHAKHVDLYLHQQGIDTTTPSGKAMFQMMGVFAEFERSMIHERVMAGLARARAGGKRLGRPATWRMMQPRSKRSEPPAPQARASGPLHASREWASGRFRALRDRTQALPREQFGYLSRISRPERANPPPGCPRSNWRQRTHNPPPKFSCFELTTGRDGGVACAENRLR